MLAVTEMLSSVSSPQSTGSIVGVTIQTQNMKRDERDKIGEMVAVT